MNRIITNPLYHGTDARFVCMPSEQRGVYLKACSVIVNHLWNMYLPYYELGNDNKMINLIGEKNLAEHPELLRGLNSLLAHLMLSKQGHGDFQYGSFYLSVSKFKACAYALKAYAGGEMGDNTYKLIKYTEQAGLADDWLNDNMKTFATNIKCFAEATPIPVIFTFWDVNAEDLLTEQGKTIDKYINDSGKLTGTDVRFMKEITLDIRDAEIVPKDWNGFAFRKPSRQK